MDDNLATEFSKLLILFRMNIFINFFIEIVYSQTYIRMI